MIELILNFISAFIVILIFYYLVSKNKKLQKSVDEINKNNIFSKSFWLSKKCSHCGNLIYVRTRPLDRQRVLVTESQASELAEQWSRTSSIDIRDHVERDEIERVQDAFRKKSGVKLSEGDAKLYIFNRELLEHTNNSDWGLYRNTKLSMGSSSNDKKYLIESNNSLLDSLGNLIPIPIHQKQHENNKQLNYSGKISVTEPIGHRKYLELSYQRNNYNNDYSCLS